MKPRSLSRFDSIRDAWRWLRSSGVGLAAALAASVIVLALTA